MKSILKDIRTLLISYFKLKLTDTTRIAKRPILSLLQIRRARPTEKGLIGRLFRAKSRTSMGRKETEIGGKKFCVVRSNAVSER
jgi:hypothetical protein